ncbi:MAG: heavy-metal-associated domain-containing protein [Bacteroidales bacterium]
MISKVNYIAVILFLGLVSLTLAEVQAQERNVEVEIAVLGNCGMCKDRIERAAYSVRGVRSASWNQREQKLTLVYRADRTDQETIERAIAKAGHDTENFITDEQTHANLHHCCIYKRNPEWLEKNKLYNEE